MRCRQPVRHAAKQRRLRPGGREFHVLLPLALLFSLGTLARFYSDRINADDIGAANFHYSDSARYLARTNESIIAGRTDTIYIGDTAAPILVVALDTEPLSLPSDANSDEDADEGSDEEFNVETTPPEAPFIDFISVGTLTKPELQDAQERTFGSHPAVRNFFRITELNDTDATCYTNLTLSQGKSVENFCKNEKDQSYESAMFRKRLSPFKDRTESLGWICAQKRPIDGLHLVLEAYKTEPLPSYLIIGDDDSYFNMDPIVGTLRNAHSEDELFVLGGCIFNHPREMRFTFPFGGFGSILTRKTIENLIRPIYCGATNPDGFTRMACWRLSQNHIGEKKFFRQGMSVADLMYSYSSHLPFTRVDQWKGGTGFCFHSDHAIGYFIGYYHVGVPEYRLDRAEPSDKLRRSNYFSYVNIGYGNQCQNERENCKSDSMICHYTKPDQMDRLFASNDAIETIEPTSIEAIELTDEFEGSVTESIIDFISVGTILKPDLQDAQERTFGSHPAVRNFIRVTELNDIDATCHTNLTTSQVDRVVEFCKNETGQSFDSLVLRRKLYSPKKHVGWMCAQKRPIDGLRLALQRYKSEPLPSYLIIVDDDSYVNMNFIMETFRASHPEEEPHVVGGCQFTFPRMIGFKFPYGGFGSILTRKAVENLIRPIYCDASDPEDGFTQMACWRLEQNTVGEQEFFREGMSVADLLYSYSAFLPFTRVDQWKNGTGFCFHSDHALGYFIGYYHVAVPDDQWTGERNDDLRRKYGFADMTGDGAGCRFEGEICTTEAHFCHYIKADQMDRLFAQQQQQQQL